MAERAGERSIGAAAARYTGLRFGLAALCFVVALAVLVPTLGGHPDVYFGAGLGALLASVPLSFVVGKGLRAELAAAVDAQRQGAAARRRDYDERIEAARRESTAE